MLDLFHQKYLKCDNSMKRDMCFMLLDISFCDNHYLNNDEVKETVKILLNLKTGLKTVTKTKKTILRLLLINHLAIKLTIRLLK